MKIKKHIKVPTGDILIVQGEKGYLEMLSLQDYGKGINVKADFLGLERDPERVTHTTMLPLEEKWVITTSSQYGCSMSNFGGCKFCDVVKVPFGGNATKRDIIMQVLTGINLYPEVKYTNRLNHHHARMGEPTLNPEGVFGSTEFLAKALPDYFDLKHCHYHPVVSTMMPRAQKELINYLWAWCGKIKNDLLKGEAGLQLSINSTDENERKWMFSGNAHTLRDIGQIMKHVPEPKGRKYTLNFAIAQWEIDPEKLLKYFQPEYYICKLTPMHKTDMAREFGIKTAGDYTEFYPYQPYEEALKEAGYDVLVFIASEYEDLGRITCGNALLGGSNPAIPHDVIYNELEE